MQIHQKYSNEYTEWQFSLVPPHRASKAILCWLKQSFPNELPPKGQISKMGLSTIRVIFYQGLTITKKPLMRQYVVKRVNAREHFACLLKLEKRWLHGENGDCICVGIVRDFHAPFLSFHPIHERQSLHGHVWWFESVTVAWVRLKRCPSRMIFRSRQINKQAAGLNSLQPGGNSN